ncbi:hypothetical protein T12_13094 [Trichinella patagoniensis]|uniref:Uncharacterized protein n=1 Tax=Trichinella patagoniensis TaxID=990121 RepID=A0A0V0ZV35_9BILA|nr:hypothetical protein T12_13094 [Trichinella patagoniensis]
MDNDLMLNNRLKECGTENIVTLKDVTYEALLSFHDESKEFQDDFRLECKEIEIVVNKVNDVCSEDHSSPHIPLKFGSKRRIDAVAILKFNARGEFNGIQTYCKFRNCPRDSLRCSLKANVFLKNSLRRSHQAWPKGEIFFRKLPEAMPGA